jgi:hypothetical protein
VVDALLVLLLHAFCEAEDHAINKDDALFEYSSSLSLRSFDRWRHGVIGISIACCETGIP